MLIPFSNYNDFIIEFLGCFEGFIRNLCLKKSSAHVSVRDMSSKWKSLFGLPEKATILKR